MTTKNLAFSITTPRWLIALSMTHNLPTLPQNLTHMHLLPLMNQALEKQVHFGLLPAAEIVSNSIHFCIANDIHAAKIMHPLLDHQRNPRLESEKEDVWYECINVAMDSQHAVCDVDSEIMLGMAKYI